MSDSILIIRVTKYEKYTSANLAKHLFNVLLQIVLFGSANVSFTIKTYQLVHCLNTFSTMINLNYCC